MILKIVSRWLHLAILCSGFLLQSCTLTSSITSQADRVPQASRISSAYPLSAETSYPAPPAYRPYPSPPNSSAPATAVIVSLAQPILGIVYNQTLQIVAVDQDSPAAQAALEPGDQLIAVNGQAVGTVAEFQRAIQPLLLSVGEVEITIKRSGEERRVTVRPGGPVHRASTPTPVPPDLYYQ